MGRLSVVCAVGRSGTGATPAPPATVITEVAAQRGGTLGNSVNEIDYVFPVDVTAGNLVVVGCSKFGTGVFTAANCAQFAGTATLEAFTLDSSIDVGSKHSAVYSARVTGSGSLTVRVSFPGGPSFPTIGCDEFACTTGWGAAASRVESVSAASAVGNPVIDSGNAASAGAALFYGTCEMSNGLPASLTIAAAYTEVFQNIVAAGGFGSQGFRITPAALVDAITWTIDIPMDWTSALAVYKGV
jgi:hypothetical protein